MIEEDLIDLIDILLRKQKSRHEFIVDDLEQLRARLNGRVP